MSLPTQISRRYIIAPIAAGYKPDLWKGLVPDRFAGPRFMVLDTDWRIWSRARQEYIKPICPWIITGTRAGCEWWIRNISPKVSY